MAELLVKQVPAVKHQLLPQLMGILKISNLMELSEQDFKKLIREVETDSLFKTLVRPKDIHNKIISYHRFPGTDLSKSFLELKEEILPGKDSFDVQMLLNKKEELVEIIRNVGTDKFKRYFLYNESSMDIEEISRECSLNVEKVKRISEFMNDFFLYEELLNAPPQVHRVGLPEYHLHYQKIAVIEKRGDEFLINYVSPSIARGKYLIHYDRLEELRENGYFNKKEKKKIKQLIKKMELINFRKAAMYRIVQTVIHIQQKYVRSNDIRDLVAYAQKDLAVEIKTKPCLVCRAIREKSIVINGGTEVPLKSFLPSKKKVRLMLIKEIADESIGDEHIRTALKEKFNISLSRRSINEYRRELKIPSRRKGRNMMSSYSRSEVCHE